MPARWPFRMPRSLSIGPRRDDGGYCHDDRPRWQVGGPLFRRERPSARLDWDSEGVATEVVAGARNQLNLLLQEAKMVVMAEAAGQFEIGVDIGGTFTDVVCRDGNGAMRLVKIPTTRRNPSAGVRAAIDYMQREWRVPPDEIVRFVHGTTVATNAVIEAKGAKIGLLTTVGFKDVLEIGRQMRHKVYDLVLKPETPGFLAPGALRKEVRERVTATGDVLVALDERSVVQAVDELVAEGVEAIAVSYLFSFLNPAHERRTRKIIDERHPRIMVSLSCEVDPAFREYERTCVTAFDAYIKPVVGRYLESMEQDLAADGLETPLQIMQSRGGISSSTIARQRPVRLFLSGPAPGVIGGLEVGRAAGI